VEECAPYGSEDGEAYDLTRARFGREAAGGVLGARPAPFRGEVVWGEPVIGAGLTSPYGGRLIMKKLVIALVVLTVCAGAASGNPGPDPRFHVDTYMGPSGEVPPGGLLGSCVWWCGTFEYDQPDGGYGNNWDDRLDLPELDLSTATYPVLTFAYRHDSEVGHDFTYVQAESLGVFVNLFAYDGYQPWMDIGIYGFVLTTYDNPLRARFRFVSDYENSDEDEGYMSIAGAFMCDNIKVYDYYGGTILFFDDAEAGCASAGEERSWGSVKAIFR
jgi:hypothetical protein